MTESKRQQWIEDRELWTVYHVALEYELHLLRTSNADGKDYPSAIITSSIIVISPPPPPHYLHAFFISIYS